MKYGSLGISPIQSAASQLAHSGAGPKRCFRFSFIVLACLCTIEGCDARLSRNNQEVSKDKSHPPATSNPEPRRSFTNSIGMKFAAIERGSFLMGSLPAESVESDEQPEHEVTLTYDFYMGTHEVTRQEYFDVMHLKPGNQKTSESSVDEGEAHTLPVVNVNWEDACEFCRRLSVLPAEIQLGRLYRLPTEAEWEYCCRAGTKTEFSTGDELASNAANFRTGQANSSLHEGLNVVGRYAPNGFGLYDMHGNAWEWCLDWYGDRFYQDSPLQDPSGPSDGTRRVIRGGGWNSSAPFCRSAFRDSKEPLAKANYLGFRVVCIAGVFIAAQKPSGQPVQPEIRAVSDVSDIIKQVEPSVVRVHAYGKHRLSDGSGFLAFDPSIIATNYHVIEAANSVTVEFVDGTKINAVGVAAELPAKDLAFLKLERPYENAKPLSFAGNMPRKGETAIAFGSPLGLAFTTTEGIISSVRTQDELSRAGIHFGPRVTWIQTTAPISPGNSGGPLVNKYGQVMGVVTMVLRGSGDNIGQNLNFAISVSDFPGREELNLSPSPFSSHDSNVRDQLKALEQIFGNSSAPQGN